MEMSRYPYDITRATQTLKKSDPVLGTLIVTVGRFHIKPDPSTNTFEALTRSIVYQQLSGRSANAIFSRLMLLGRRNLHPTPRQILRYSNKSLRNIGLSMPKIRYLKNLAREAITPSFPTFDKLDQMSDQTIIDQLTLLNGIGIWSVQMLLLNCLKRPDVLPASDLGIRKGFKRLLSLNALPSEATVLARGFRWQPYRSIASWYLWQANHL